MKFDISIDQALLAVYSQIRLGLLRFTAQVQEPDAPFWAHMEQNILPDVRAAIEGKEWSEIPGIRGSRAAYRAFGRNPGRYRVSSEALLRRVRRGDALYAVNSVVDVNNLISVKSGMSVGSYDLRQVHGAIRFRQAQAGEGYTGIGKDFLDMENMLVLADEEGIFGSSISDSTRAMVTEHTQDVLVVLYCFEDDLPLEAILDEASQAFKKYAGATDVEAWII